MASRMPAPNMTAQVGMGWGSQMPQEAAQQQWEDTSAPHANGNGDGQLFSPPISSVGLPSKHQGKDYVYQEGCSLIVNYLPATMTNEELQSLFSVAGQIQSCKVMRDPKTGISKGFGFVNYISRDDAERAIRHYNGLRLQSKVLKVSFARPSSDEIKNTNVYVTGLPAELPQEELETLFAPYGTIITSTLLRDGRGMSRGQGLVRYNIKAEADAAIQALNNTTPPSCTGPITVRFANPPTNKAMGPSSNGGPGMHIGMMSPPTSPPPGPGGQHGMPPPQHGPSPMSMGPGSPAGGGGPIRGPMRGPGMRFSPMDKNNPMGAPMPNSPGQIWPIYVCPLEPDAEDVDLYRLFSPFGAIQSARVIKDTQSGQCKGFGFINMSHYQEAIRAIQSLDGTLHKGKTISVSFKVQKQKGQGGMM